MTKHERIIRLPAVVISRSVAERIAELMHELAETRVSAILEERLRALYRGGHDPLSLFVSHESPAQITEEEFIHQNIDDEAFREMLRPAYGDKYTFLSPHGNKQFLYDDFTYEDIPKDVDLALAEATGPRGEILAFAAKARSQVLDLQDPNQNRILIQGPERAWVNDSYERLREIVAASKEPVRSVVYHWMPVFVWLTFFILAYLEYRLIHRFTGFAWDQPLNGLQLLTTFAMLAITLIACSWCFQLLLPLMYPYVEFEENLSRSRKMLRAPVVAAIVALYGAGVLFLFGLG